MRSQPFSQVADGLVMEGFDRSDRDIHGLRYFMVRAFLVVLHDENRFLPVRQTADASGEFASHIGRFMNAVAVIPGRIEFLDASVRLESLCFPAVFPVSVDGQVSGDLEKPILEIAARTKHMDFPEHPEKSLLHNVQRVLPVPDNRKGQDENSLLEKPGYGHESLTVSFPDFFDKPGKLFIRHGLVFCHAHERLPCQIPVVPKIPQIRLLDFMFFTVFYGRRPHKVHPGNPFFSDPFGEQGFRHGRNQAGEGREDK